MGAIPRQETTSTPDWTLSRRTELTRVVDPPALPHVCSTSSTIPHPASHHRVTRPSLPTIASAKSSICSSGPTVITTACMSLVSPRRLATSRTTTSVEVEPALTRCWLRRRIFQEQITPTLTLVLTERQDVCKCLSLL